MYALTRMNDRSNWSPFREMEQMTRNLFSRDPGMFNMDIADAGDHYELSADLPGMKKEDIHLQLEGDLLTISAERRNEYEDKGENGYIRMERSYGSFSRTIDVTDIDKAGITAAYTDGVLKLHLPKKPEIIPDSRTIEVQ